VVEDDRLWEERFAETYETKRAEASERLRKRRERDRDARLRRAGRAGHKPYIEPTAEELGRLMLERDRHHDRRREIEDHYEAEQQTERARARKQEIAKRLNEGFEWPGGRYGGETYQDGYRRDAFGFQGLRSDEHAILKLFVSKLPRAAKGLQVGTLKSAVHGTRSKLLGLDEPIVTFCEVMRGVWRVDVDGTFASTAAIYRALNELRVPWPNIVTGFRDEAGQWIRPHFYFLLEHSVCFSDRGDVRLMRLFDAIGRGLVHALLRIGADPGGLSNPNRGKNPLSPLWHSEIIRDEPWSMDEIKDRVCLNVSKEHLVRLAAEVLEPVVALKDGTKLPSNSFFTRLQERAFDIVGAHHKAGDYDQFAAEMQVCALELCGAFGSVKERVLRAVARRVTDYVWSHHDPKAKPHAVRRGRGRCHHEVQGKTMRERQQIGGRATASARRAASVAAIVAAHGRLVEQGRAAPGVLPKPGILAAEAGVSAETLRVCRAEVAAALAAESQRRCIDKKLPPPSDRSDVAPVPARRGEEAAPFPADASAVSGTPVRVACAPVRGDVVFGGTGSTDGEVRAGVASGPSQVRHPSVKGGNGGAAATRGGGTGARPLSPGVRMPYAAREGWSRRRLPGAEPNSSTRRE